MRPRYIALLILLSIMGCERRPDKSAADSSAATNIEADVRLVAIEARLNRHYSAAGAKILVRTPTSTHGFLDFENITREEFIEQLCQPDQGTGLLDRSTAEAFIRANESPTEMDAGSFSNVDWISTIPEDRFKGYWAGDGSTEEGWDKLRQDFPDTVGVVEVSAIGWNHDRSEGVIYVGALSPPGIGQGGFFVLRRYGSQYSCQELMMAPSWMTKANKPKMATPYSGLVAQPFW